MKWGHELVGMFFSPSMEGQQVRLSVSSRMLDEALPNLGGSQGLVNACLACPLPGGQQLRFHEKARRLYNIWQLRPETWSEPWKGMPDGAPFYLPHLAVLCLAWTVDGEKCGGQGFTSNAYYCRLNTLLPSRDCMGTSELKDLLPLWEGLQTWTQKLEGRRGRFEIEVVGQAFVGMPLAQVLFTPEKVSHLPELFVSTELAVNWQNITPERLGNVILQHPSLSQKVLGMLYNEVLKDTSIGKSVVKRVWEELQHTQNREWARPIELNGGVYGQSAGGGKVARPTDTIWLRCVLESVNSNPPAWRCHLGISEEAPPVTPPEQRDWRYRRVVSGSGGLWLVETDHMDDLPGPFEGGDFLCPTEPGLDEEDVRIRQPQRAIRLFGECWASPALIVEKDDGIPVSGGCFALVSSQAVEGFSNWAQALVNAGGALTDYSRDGLPIGSRFFHLSSLERLGAADRLNFPEPSLMRAAISKAIRLIGGSQVHGAGRQQVYLPYDLPDVKLEAPGHVRLQPDPVNLVILHPDIDAPSGGGSQQAGGLGDSLGLPGNVSRAYRLELTGDCEMVRLHAVSDNPAWTGQMVSFALAASFSSEHGVEASSVVRFDNQGRRNEGSGILGCIIDEVALGKDGLEVGRWFYDVVPFDMGLPATEEDIFHPAWQLLESLAHAAGGKVNATEFRRRCERQLGLHPRIIWRESRWLRALCHVEVERDDRARIKLVHRVPPQAYLLPWRALDPSEGGGMWMAVVAGCPTTQNLQKLLELSAGHGVQVIVKDRGNPLLPPRWLCTCQALEGLKSLFDAAGFDYGGPCAGSDEGNVAIPPALKVASWSTSLKQWLEQLKWQSGLATNYESEFNPYTFLADAAGGFKCPCRLVQKTDSLTGKHQWHMISRIKVDQTTMDFVSEHAYLIDPTWGRWLSCRKVADQFGANEDNAGEGQDLPTPIPYDVDGSNLNVAGSMVFPAILSRALVLCSGMPPAAESRVSYFAAKPCLFTPDPESPYTHTVLSYGCVPQAVAEAVCAKVRARIVPQYDNQSNQA